MPTEHRTVPAITSTETWKARFRGGASVPVRVDRHVDAERGEWFYAHASNWPGVPYALHLSGNSARYAVERVVAEGLAAARTDEAGCGFEGISPPGDAPEPPGACWYAQGPEPREAGAARHSVCRGTRAEHLRGDDDSHACVAVAWGDTEEEARRTAERIAEDHGAAARLREVADALGVGYVSPSETAPRCVAEAKRLRGVAAAVADVRRDVVAGVLAAMAAGVAAGDDRFPRAAATQAEFDEAVARWEAVAVRCFTGIALYDRDGAGGFTLSRMATQTEDDAFIRVHQTMAAALLAWRSAAEGARAERDEVELLRADVKRLRDREQHFAAALRVADGGRYRNDWGGALSRLLAERDEALAVVQGSEAEPTDAELDELAVVGGHWRCVVPGLPRLNRDAMHEGGARAHREALRAAGRKGIWWALDEENRPRVRPAAGSAASTGGAR